VDTDETVGKSFKDKTSSLNESQVKSSSNLMSKKLVKTCRVCMDMHCSGAHARRLEDANCRPITWPHTLAYGHKIGAGFTDEMLVLKLN